MLFAPRAHASPVAGGAIAMTGEAGQLPQSMAGAVEAQTGSPQASVGTIAGAVADVAERISSAGGSSAEGSTPTPTTSGTPPESTGASTAPSEPTTQTAPEEAAPPPSGSSQSGVSPTAKVVTVASDASATQSHPAQGDALATVATAGPAADATSNHPTAAASAADRERQAQAAVRLWPSSALMQGGSMGVFLPDLQRFMAEFLSLASDITTGSTAGGTAAPTTFPGAAAQELTVILTSPDAPWLNAPAGISLLPPRGAWAVRAQRLGALYLDARAPDAMRALRRTSVATSTATSPTVVSSLPSAAGAAVGSGMTGAAVPAVALLALVAVCLLGTWLPRRLAVEGLACKSALLNLRLERPG